MVKHSKFPKQIRSPNIPFSSTFSPCFFFFFSFFDFTLTTWPTMKFSLHQSVLVHYNFLFCKGVYILLSRLFNPASIK